MENPDLVELRGMAARLREQTRRIAAEADQQKAALRDQRRALQREREESEKETREAWRRGELSPEQAAIVQRIERGDTSWAGVVHGTDTHSSAQEFRASFARQTESVVADLRAADPEFRAEHDRALAAAERPDQP
ncbi:hypothetical protein I601_0337 [Nocardioides dokdonensis FR1436]|uniref:Uncharacterized protein n=1 Tax=Nocardioides dokdonensis FR1436 TaxID=1300347 RepID=A0A1A9GGH9_9ACTN|nr:hypothetical protein [Nocardioides dokdonensis]ANH36790.1 hypothetical protein I601_0337 [Nocardioides dokdonensis FR1436]